MTAAHPHRPRKRFGQNFLVDRGVVDKIVRAIAPRTDDAIVEIGPGQGALTLPLLAHCPKLNIIEVDRDLVAGLENLKNDFPDLRIHQGDALRFDFSQLTDREATLRIVGNLPYNISTPLLFHLLEYSTLLCDMHFMLQKEVVERMASTPGKKTYGRLSVMVQYFCQVDSLFTVDPACFKPAPKVDSAVVRLTPHRTLPLPAEDYSVFRHLVGTCFQQRRKTLRNSLRTLLPTEAIASLDLDTTIRPDNLTIRDFVTLANVLTRYRGGQR